MPTGFRDVPDWTFWENQGAGVAVADLDGGGTSDLVVFVIDNRARAEPRAVTASAGPWTPTGIVTGGWTHGPTCPTGSRGRTRAAGSRWPT